MGQHTGRGPKGFKRSDERIKEEVCEMLSRDGSIDADDIVVEIQDRRLRGETIQTVASALGVSPSVVFKYAPGKADRKTGFLKKETGETEMKKHIGM